MEDQIKRLREIALPLSAFSFVCDRCGYSDTIPAITPTTGAAKAVSDGWRVVDGEALCPRCVIMREVT